MRLYKNVDIEDLQAILNEGILPISATGNNNWDDGKRVDNSEDLVYLFSKVDGGKNSFPQYGMVLLEVEVNGAEEKDLDERDVNKGNYVEHVAIEVKPKEILAAYFPAIYKEEIERRYHLNDSRIQYVEIAAKVFSHSKLVPTEENPFNTEVYYKEATPEEILLLINEDFIPLNTFEMGFFRGLTSDNVVIDFHEIQYII